jgi:hypothetical protein
MTPEEREAERKQRRRDYYQKNKEREKAVRKAWAEANPEYDAARQRDWRAANPEKLKAQQKRNGKASDSKRRAAYNALKESFGCLNPSCQWAGPYVACLLDFHHIDKAGKAGCVSQMLDSPDRMRAEIAKCTLLCANCHRLVTYGELDDSGLPLCEV